MATVKNQVVESLLGTSVEPQLSRDTRAAFMKHALQDNETNEWFLDESKFIDAIAPETEDYVSNID
jgi:solute carrier family 25 (mitochondrial aspartate/glutamate transporter), member 12/13